MPPVVQNEYSENIGVAVVGAPAAPDWDADSRIVETAAGIGFGLAVGRGSGERGVVIGGAQFAGISMRDITQPATDADPDEYQQYNNIGVMTRGLIWVEPDVDVLAGELVHYDSTTGVLSNTGGTLIEGATFESNASANGLAKVRLSGHLPSAAAAT